jgi:pimeloyl-ACP methyl ester carboxylesterase
VIPDPPGLYRVPGGHRLGARQSPPALILLPGIACDSRVFARQVPLSRRRSTLALDLPSPHGTLQSAAAALLSQIPSPRFAIFGASLGGLVGWAMSLLAPERVTGLITLGTLPSPAWIPRTLSANRRLVAATPPALFSALYRRRIAARLVEEGVSAELRGVLLSSLPSSAEVSSRLGMILRWGLTEPVVPSMWLLGQHDVESRWSAGDVSEVLPGVMVQSVAGGHRAQVTHPVMLHGFIEHFLRGVR